MLLILSYLDCFGVEFVLVARIMLAVISKYSVSCDTRGNTTECTTRTIPIGRTQPVTDPPDE